MKRKLQQIQIFGANGRIASSKLKLISPTMRDEIIQATQFLQFDPKLSIRIRAIFEDVVEHKRCSVCHTNYVQYSKQSSTIFSDFCSHACAVKSKTRLIKTQQTNLKKYGAMYHQQTAEGKHHRQQTNLAKYGAITPVAHDSIRTRIKQTNLIKYGHQNVLASEYGRCKIAETNQNKYGSVSYQTAKLSSNTIAKLHDPIWLRTQNTTNKKDLSTIAAELDCSTACVHQHFQKHNIPVHRQHSSTFEREVVQFIKSINPEVAIATNTKINNIEYDIWIPERSIAIECNGIYWHSELNGRDRTYHLRKTTNGMQYKTQVIHIFETDWHHKQNIVKSRISNLLYQTPIRIHARKCKCVQLTNQETNKFLSENHLQGSTSQSKHCYGLIYQDQLVACLSVGGSRFNKRDQYEILRYAAKINTSVIGGFSKTFNSFVADVNPAIVVTYADLCWGTGNVYKHAGFVFEYNTSPAYKYFKTNNCMQLFNRQQFQKHKLRTKLTNMDPTLSEWENMINNGYDRIWDCGNAKWKWTSLTPSITT